MIPSQKGPSQLLSGRSASAGTIVRVGSDRLGEAVERLVAVGREADQAHALSFLEFAAANAVSLDGMWARLDHLGKIECTVLGVPSPGRTAMVFASHPRHPGQASSIGGVIDHACQELAGLGVDLAQSLLDLQETLEQEAFIAGGFVKLATLSYLERPMRSQRRPPPPAWPADVQVERYHAGLRSELLRVLEASYEDTLDCPGLRGLRRTEDILEGHKSSGRFDPKLWTLLRIGGRALGALLLNPSAGQNTVELVYLGLAPSARGRGLGSQLLRHGLKLLEGRPERSLTLAVDEGNAPALALYQREGFRQALRRIAMIRPLRSATSVR